MKLWSARAATCCALLFLLTDAARAQDTDLKTDLKKYAVDVRLEPAASAATVRTTLSVWNPTDAPKRRFQFRINAKAEVRAVTFNGQPATFTAAEDKRYTRLNVVTVTLPSAIPGRGTGDVAV